MPKSKNFRRRSLDLTHEQWQELDKLAKELGSLALTGLTVKQPSWRALIKEIADGTIELTKESKP